MPAAGGIPGLRDGGISKTPSKKRFHTIASSTPSRTPGRSRDAVRQSNVSTPGAGMRLFQHAADRRSGGHDEESNGGDSNIKVFVRVRPLNSSEKTGSGDLVVSVPTGDTIVLNGSEPKPFTFDCISDADSTQQQMFEMIGQPFADSFLAGYNGCIFAYGQTGSGKTYTMQGPELDISSSDERAGLIPRTLEYLFERIAEKRNAASVLQESSLQYVVKCSYLEIYNETISDLLDTSKVNLQVRENNRDGIYVDGITWENVGSASETLAVLMKGVRNRHVGETAMNKESSRSHSVFTMCVEGTLKGADGLTKKRHSVLNLVDLAGSERQKSTNASGDRLKEATNINKSLSALGNVIMALADVSDGKTRHVHYRDSKLTFLLKDSLGGNSKTAIIANVSPSEKSFGETLSTLKFAQRAKLIKTRAILNEDTSGNVEQLRQEIKRLKEQIKTGAAAAAAACAPASNAPPRARDSSGSSTSSSSTPGGEQARELQGRVRELENLLFQCLEQQAASECEVESARELSERAQALVDAQKEDAENETFMGLRTQIKLKNETIKALDRRSKGTEVMGEVEELLRKENEELRRAQELSWASNPEAAKLARENLRLNQLVSGTKGSDVEARRVVDTINRELRDQYMAVCRDRRRLEGELAAALANSNGNSSPARRLASMTTPERMEYEGGRLAQWKEEQKFGEKIAAMEAELENAKRNALAYKSMLEVAQRQGSVNGQAPESCDSVQTPAVEVQAGGSITAEELEGAKAEAERAQRAEKQLRSQLEAAEYALSVMESRNMGGRKSLSSVDEAKLQLAREETEALQIKVQSLQDELDGAREEQKFEETRSAKLEAQVAELEAKAKDHAKLSAARGEAEDVHVKLASLEKEIEEAKESLGQSQAAYEAAAKELKIVSEVLRTTQSQLEAKESLLEQSKADLLSSSAEAQDLKASLDGALEECTKVSTMLAETKRRHEALIDDREGTEKKHQAELDEMMAELKRRQAIITTLENDSAQANKRLSSLEVQTVEVTHLRDQIDTIRKTAEAKDSEIFEVNFELQGAQRNLKLVTADNEELEARLEETYQASIEQKKMIERYESENEALRGEVAEARSAVEAAAAEVEQLEAAAKQRQAEADQLGSRVGQMGEVAEASAKRCMELERAVDEAKARGVEGEAAIKELAAKKEEIAGLRGEMCEWISEMKHLKDMETKAKEEAAEHKQQLSVLEAKMGQVQLLLDAEVKKTEELNEINSKLIGHGNAKQKVQHTVKLKEECNQLSSELKAAQTSLVKAKDKGERLEKEVNKLRAALGVEGGAAQVLAEEAVVREQVGVKEEECADLKKRLDMVEAAARELLGDAGADVSEGATDVLAEKLKDHVGRQLSQKQQHIEQTDFTVAMLRKEMSLLKGTPADSENKHPNSPSAHGRPPTRAALRSVH